MKKVMVFGVFNNLHEGHHAMLKEAKSLGNYLIAVITQDHIVEELKGRLPKKNLAERFDHLKRVTSVDEVAIGDSKLGNWHVVKKHAPNIIAIGYDQETLRKHLELYIKTCGFFVEWKTLKSFYPDKYKSSILNGKSV